MGQRGELRTTQRAKAQRRKEGRGGDGFGEGEGIFDRMNGMNRIG
jgi:hypothetical protein